MTNSKKQYIFFVDDEPEICKVVRRSLDQTGFKVSCFTRATDCLGQLRSQRCDLLITDVKMPGMSGLELLSEARRLIPSLPVLVISAYGDIPMAVKALKAGALDFIEKPLDRQCLLSAVESALGQIAPADELLSHGLTNTEIRVLRLILDGKSNKEAAHFLHRSVRTIEAHRSRIMCKLGVNSAVGLGRRAVEIGLVGSPTG